uniref:Uncharacterized protein n=1 Tax=Anguilla anguilla TaxID=7936 RepID=A0A0E9PNH2_ANGAN
MQPADIQLAYISGSWSLRRFIWLLLPGSSYAIYFFFKRVRSRTKHCAWELKENER